MTELEKQREYQRKWRVDNREHCIQYQRDNRQKNQFNPDYIVSKMWHDAKYRSSKRGTEFNITKEQLYNKIVETNGFCELSGLPLTVQYKNPLKLSLDRIDNTKGYTLKNIQIVATCVNDAKNDLHIKAFIKMCKAVAERNK